MFRVASRAGASSRCLLPRAPSARRFLSTAPPTQKSRSWKSSAARWAIAVGAIYYYGTSSGLAEDAAYAVISDEHDGADRRPTIESIIAKKRARAAQASPSASVPPTQGTIEEEAAAGLGEVGPAPGSPEALEEEAGQQGAFNPETGEINWDCPCLGGMANGPCGEDFKAAFSCFVYSKEEPKGMDCIDKFKNMQDCFRQYPEIYGDEIADDGAEDNDNDVDASVGQDLAAAPVATPSGGHERAEKVADHKPHHPPSPEHEVKGRTDRAKNASQQVKDTQAALEQAEAEAVVPKEWHENK